MPIGEMATDSTSTVGELFDRHPVQFGLRGDVHLWNALRIKFAATPLPSSWFEMRRLVQTAVERIIGRPLDARADPESVYVPEFDPGRGMSAGHVHISWWITTGIPILLDRFEAKRQELDARPSAP